MFTDYHVHTEFSDDSDYLMEDVIKDAITMKMDEIFLPIMWITALKGILMIQEECIIERVDLVNQKRCHLQMWIIQNILKRSNF